MDKIRREGERKSITQSGQSFRSYLLIALIIIGVVALGLLAINQFLGFIFKAQFLGSPCDLCEELNPHLKRCFEVASKIVIDKGTGEVLENPLVINVEN